MTAQQFFEMQHGTGQAGEIINKQEAIRLMRSYHLSRLRAVAKRRFEALKQKVKRKTTGGWSTYTKDTGFTQG